MTAATIPYPILARAAEIPEATALVDAHVRTTCAELASQTVHLPVSPLVGDNI